MDRLRRMLSGADSHARGPDPGSPRQDGHISFLEPRAEAPRKEACREDLQSHKPSPTLGRNPEGQTCCPSWGARPGQEETQASAGLRSTQEPLSTGSRAARGPLDRLGRRREARLPFSRFLDEVTVRVLDPRTLEAFRGPRGRSPEPSPGEQGPAQEPLTGAAAPEKTLALNPPLSTAEAASRPGPGWAVETSGSRIGSGKNGGQAASPRKPASRVSLSLSPPSSRQLGRRLLWSPPSFLCAFSIRESWLTPSEFPHHTPFILSVTGKTLRTKRMNL